METILSLGAMPVTAFQALILGIVVIGAVIVCFRRVNKNVDEVECKIEAEILATDKDIFALKEILKEHSVHRSRQSGFIIKHVKEALKEHRHDTAAMLAVGLASSGRKQVFQGTFDDLPPEVAEALKGIATGETELQPVEGGPPDNFKAVVTPADVAEPQPKTLKERLQERIRANRSNDAAKKPESDWEITDFPTSDDQECYEVAQKGVKNAYKSQPVAVTVHTGCDNYPTYRFRSNAEMLRFFGLPQSRRPVDYDRMIGDRVAYDRGAGYNVFGSGQHFATIKVIKTL